MRCNLARENPDQAGGVLRHRLRDDGAGQRDGRLPGQTAGSQELLDAGVARAGPAGHRGHPAVADEPRAGVPGRRPRLHRDGHCRVSAARRQVRRTDRGHRFEPLDILEGIRRTVLQLESGRHEMENAYPRAVQAEGNPAAKAMCWEVFEVTDRAWRGIGKIPRSGWRLSPALPRLRRRARFSVAGITTGSRRFVGPARCYRE